MFVHTVYYWVDEKMPADVRKRMIADCSGLLSRIPGVKHAWGGVPAGTDRPIVDNSYDIGLCVIFDDRAGHDAYQVDPLHTEFVGNYKPYWKRVVVYDFHKGA